MINGLGEAAIQVYYLLSNEVRSPPREIIGGTCQCLGI